MRTLKRTLEKIVKNISPSFPILLITGARQIGKTTLLEQCSEGRAYVSLDNLDDRILAKNDPALFLQRYKPPLIIDEVQYAPELFSYIKIISDRERKNGLFWLTGSQKFHLMKNVTESLAGRVAIIDMLGLSQSEIEKRIDSAEPFLPTNKWIEKARKNARRQDLMIIYDRIWKGSFPALWAQEDDRSIEHDIFYNSYVQTYIQRDVRDLTKVGNELTFQIFLKAVAARTGQLLNYADMARDVGVDQKTIKSWIYILETSGLIYLLYPYHNNITKRLIKTPKLYFLDTGLCAYLTNWTSSGTLEAGAMSGSILENYIICEILKSYWHHGKTANFYYYRDMDQKEVDLIIEQDNKLYPVEFKKTAIPTRTASKNFSILNRLDKPIAEGAVVCLRESDTILSENIYAIPVAYI
ncbi:MAG: ATP-binding protein [Pseudomonadota bacterium]